MCGSFEKDLAEHISTFSYENENGNGNRCCPDLFLQTCSNDVLFALVELECEPEKFLDLTSSPHTCRRVRNRVSRELEHTFGK